MSILLSACGLSASMCSLCVCEWKAKCFVRQRASSCVSAWSLKERETETLPKVLKLGSFYSGIMAIPGDRLSLLSGLHYPPLFPALTKGQWVCRSNFLNHHTKSASVGRRFDLEPTPQ